MPNVKVNTDTEGFTIEAGTVKRKVNIGELFIKQQTAYPEIARFASFDTLNSSINHADSVKDKTSQASLAGLGLYQSTPFTLQELKTMTHNIIDTCKQNGTITRQLFTKDKKGDNSVKDHYKGLLFDIGFDSGLGLENYLHKEQFKICETFGKYIDPTTFRDANTCFPEQGSRIVITPTTFNLLGYENCAVDFATRVGQDKYTYDIVIGGKRMVNNTIIPKKSDANIKTIFVGNTAKKGIANTDTLNKIAAVVGKSLGDKLQVFILFIKSKLESSSRITSISTCDEIVLLFCILLELPCFYTAREDAKGQKLKEVLYFNPDNTNPTKAKEKFKNEKKIVIKGYDDLIRMLRPLNETSVVYVSGDETKPRSYPKAFFEGLVQDLEFLKREAEAKTDGGSTDITSIFQATGVIQSMAVNNFIRQSRDKRSYLLTRTANKYSNYATSYNKEFLMRKIGSSRQLTSATFSSIADSIRSLSDRLVGGTRFTSYADYFDTEPALVYLDDGSSFDARAELVAEIQDIVLNVFGIDDVKYIDFYSELLHTFVRYPDYSTQYLVDTIGRIYYEIKQNEQNEAMAGPISFVGTVAPRPRYSKKSSAKFPLILSDASPVSDASASPTNSLDSPSPIRSIESEEEQPLRKPSMSKKRRRSNSSSSNSNSRSNHRSRVKLRRVTQRTSPPVKTNNWGGPKILGF